ncbi:DUF397 domain-containing protein [Catellatospora citrea]|uniref:DUF397 domain-containing protein n=1 Tax=Catellatospora citrea TaxID=53366 RepID=A0A8J3KT03_9ACTN|nr:DUF397 domain-containing protein [Catellatospora citrea]RKE08494.1 uncharacterized protein DUF397 [Catellatospora citrea]GIG01420.1 hypothetical protein Cci01nite_65130 [Catellatospora citrea]
MANSTDDHETWRKSSRSDNNGGQCVEVALSDTFVGLRDSKDQNGAVLTFTTDDWAAFLTGVKAGEFDR